MAVGLGIGLGSPSSPPASRLAAELAEVGARRAVEGAEAAAFGCVAAVRKLMRLEAHLRSLIDRDCAARAACAAGEGGGTLVRLFATRIRKMFPLTDPFDFLFRRGLIDPRSQRTATEDPQSQDWQADLPPPPASGPPSPLPVGICDLICSPRSGQGMWFGSSLVHLGYQMMPAPTFPPFEAGPPV